jgi:hypothetical protein
LSYHILLNTIGLAFNLVGSIFFGLAFILRSKTIKEIAATKWKGNPDVEKWLKNSRQEGVIGLILLALGFFIQASAQFIN